MKGGLRRGVLQPRASPITGIKNLGNTCFLNVVLQSLMSVRSFQTYLHADETVGRAPLTSALRQSFRHLSKPYSLPYDPTPMLHAVPVLQNTFAQGQHDPEELLQYLMSILAEERKEEDKGSSTTESHGKRDKRRTKNPFSGRLISVLKCNQCGDTRDQTHEFIDLSLAIPETTDFQPSLLSCLKHFTQAEEVAGVRCNRCIIFRHELRRKPVDVLYSGTSYVESLAVRNDRAPLVLCQKIKGCDHIIKLDLKTKNGEESEKTESILRIPMGVSEWSLPASVKAKKELSIHETPRALCLHLQRLVTVQGVWGPIFTKNNAKVSFPLELELSKFCIPAPHEQIKYNLVAVIVHHGSADGGHFTVFRKLVPNQAYSEGLGHLDWVHISDEVCQPVSQEKVLNQPPYMLFYEKA